MIKDLLQETKRAIAIAPAARGAGTVNGSTIDRLGYEQGIFEVQRGAITGSPSAFTLNVHAEESADGSVWADITSASITEMADDSASSELQEIALNLLPRKRYIRAVGVVTVTGGSTPLVPYSVMCVLGRAANIPQPVSSTTYTA